MEGEGAAPAIVTAHAFVPRGEWFTVCRECGLAEAAHAASTLVEPDEDERVMWLKVAKR